MTWTAAAGQIPRNDLLGFETTPKGQALRLKKVFSTLARQRKRLRIGRVYWYNWASEYIPTFAVGGPGTLTFQYAGLNKVSGSELLAAPRARHLLPHRCRVPRLPQDDGRAHLPSPLTTPAAIARKA